MSEGSGLIHPTKNLQSFFKERIECAVEKHNIDHNEDTLWYLTQLLCDYSQTNHFLDNNGHRAALTPLAEYYRRALESNTQYERRQQLRRLGDVAIVVSSLFSGALTRKTISIEYYISMGEAAYATLADETTYSARERALQYIFETLSNEFSDYVVALSEIPDNTDHQHDLLQMVDDWHRNKHPAIARQLRNKGVLLQETAPIDGDNQVIH